MKKFRFTLLCLLSLVVLTAVPRMAVAAPSMTPLPSFTKATPFLPIAEQIGAQLQSLVAPPPAPPATPGDDTVPEPTPTFGTRALNVVINVTEILRVQAQHFFTEFAALPQLSDWFNQQRNDPRLLSRWQTIGNDVLETAGIALLVALAAEILLYPIRSVIRQRNPSRLLARIAVVLSLFSLRAIPIIIFVATSVVLLNQYDIQKLSRYLILNMVYALALARIMVSFLRGVFSPKTEGLRFIPATMAQAVYGYRWLRAFGIIILFGYFLTIVARAVRVPEDAVTAFINVFGLILVMMGIIVIVQKRAFVAQLIRGNLSAAQHRLTWLDSLRLWFARHWHKLAIVYLVVGYAIAATGIQDGLSVMLRGTLLTLLVLVATRLLFHAIRVREATSEKGTTTLYALIKGVSLRLIIIMVAIASTLAAWGADMEALASSTLGHRLLGATFSIGVTLFILGLIYEFFSSIIDQQLSPSSEEGKKIEVTARARTLLPMLRNALLLTLMGIIGIVVLSEAGINIGPLLAGAGVVGVAVGFGSQTLVKDFLTGLFIVLENTIAVGDVVKIGSHSGVVETMSMRTLRLRDMDGALHILSFSEVSQIINMTRGFAHAVISVNVGISTNLDKALECIQMVGVALQNDANIKNSILEPVEILGVDAMSDASVTLVARMRTKAGEQWTVKRLFLLRLKQQFDKEGIQLPGNATTVFLQKQT